MRRFLASPDLRPYVKTFVANEGVEEVTYDVIPGTSIVMGFQYRGRLAKIITTSVLPLSACGITGLASKVMTFKSSKNVGTILVYFSEMGAAAFLPVPAHELFGESYALSELLSHRVEEVEEQLSEAVDDVQRLLVVEAFLRSHLRQHTTDSMVKHAINIISSTEGNIRMSELSDKLNISIGQMEKRFRNVVGATPKKFASIVRFNTILKYQPTSKTLIELAHRVGYFDQAHFIKDFKAFTGQTPERYFSSCT